MVCPKLAAASPRPQGPRAPTIGDIFREHGDAYRQAHPMTPQQHVVMRAIERCRTEALGGRREVCNHCGFERNVYNSCRNRHCPGCQSLDQNKWLTKRMEQVLPTMHYHCVFTLPAPLRPLARRHPARIYSMLFRAAADTLLTLGRDPRRLGAELGITAVLHTWTRELKTHPHVHCLVTGGGLSLDGTRWIAARRNYLFPAKVLSRLFRGKFLAALKKAHARGEITFVKNSSERRAPRDFAQLLARLYRSKWVVYAKRPFGGRDHVFQYVARYTHRIGISNRRIQSATPDAIRFATKHGKSVTVKPHEFIRRFLQHVLPKGYVKIRHYGLMAGGKHPAIKREIARGLLLADVDEEQKPDVEPTPETWQEHLRALTGIDPTLCPQCGVGTMIPGPLLPANSNGWAGQADTS